MENETYSDRVASRVIFMLILQYWPEMLNWLRKTRKFPRSGTFLVPNLFFLFTFQSFYSSFNSVNFHRSCPPRIKARLAFYWMILNWTFLLSILPKWLSYLRIEMQKSDNESVQNTKLQTMVTYILEELEV